MYVYAYVNDRGFVVLATEAIGEHEVVNRVQGGGQASGVSIEAERRRAIRIHTLEVQAGLKWRVPCRCFALLPNTCFVGSSSNHTQRIRGGHGVVGVSVKSLRFG